MLRHLFQMKYSQIKPSFIDVCNSPVEYLVWNLFSRSFSQLKKNEKFDVEGFKKNYH